MAAALARRARATASTAVAFGDLFLEDVRRYREQQHGRHRRSSRCSRCGAGRRARWPRR